MFKNLAVAAAAGIAVLTGCSSTAPSTATPSPSTGSYTASAAETPSAVAPAPPAPPPAPTADASTFWYDGTSTRTGPARGYFFQSPSGKWRCAIIDRFYDGIGAGCEAVNSRLMPVPGAPLVPANDLPQNLVPPSSLIMKPNHGPEFIKLGQPYLVRPEDPTPVLGYGLTLTGLGFTCNTQESGISCRNDQSGQGFTFSSKGYRFEYTPVSPAPADPAPAPAATDRTIVLGAPSDQYSVGYGSARPATISTNSLCGNTITDVVWESWGDDVARGSGTWCQSAGAQSRGEPLQHVALTATDVGNCGGQLAYRALQFDAAQPTSICQG